MSIGNEKETTVIRGSTHLNIWRMLRSHFTSLSLSLTHTHTHTHTTTPTLTLTLPLSFSFFLSLSLSLSLSLYLYLSFSYLSLSNVSFFLFVHLFIVFLFSFCSVTLNVQRRRYTIAHLNDLQMIAHVSNSQIVNLACTLFSVNGFYLWSFLYVWYLPR